MLTIADETLLGDFETAEKTGPIADKKLSITPVYDLRLPETQATTTQLPPYGANPSSVTLDKARIGTSHKGLVQPELYRAPEVRFDMEWSSSLDIWNVACLLSHVCVHVLFFSLHITEVDQKTKTRFGIGLRIGICLTRWMKVGISSVTHHIAEMVAYLGLPPLEYIRRSEVTKKGF